MYQEHPILRAPDDPDMPIWRYIDFPKFVDMLERRALHFSQLSSLDDPFEGMPSDWAIGELRRANEEMLAKLIADGTVAPGFRFQGPTGHPYFSFSLLTYVNCWNMSAFESAAMWRLYSRDGVAIRSTFRHFAESFAAARQQISIGTVTYFDRRSAAPSEVPGDAFGAAFRKGMSFEHERELRASYLFDLRTEGYTALTSDELPRGVNIAPVDLDVLIDAVYVAPKRPLWYRELIEKVMATYGLEKPLENSALDDRPDLT